MRAETTTKTKGFTQEQITSLVSALGKLDVIMPQQNASAGEAVPETYYGTPLEDLCKEEVAKYKCHPLDIYDRLEQWTLKNEIAAGLDQFLLRHLGFFNVEPTSPGYMVRLRLPACQLTGDQMCTLAHIAETYGGGYAHVTTRGNIQIREIEPKNVLNVIDSLNGAGLTCHGSGADSARNMTASPAAGFDGSEIIDLSPYTKRLSNLVLNTRDLRALPRKFNISFDNGGVISCVSDSNDIAFQAVEIGEGAEVEPGVYCRIGLGGISGHKDLTRDTGFICTPEQSVMAGFAMLYVFIEHGDRTNRKKARLKYVLDKHGVDWFIERTQEKLDELEAGFNLTPVSAEHDKPRPPVNRQGHIGAHKQKEDGLNYVGLAMEMGRLEPDQMRMIGRLAREYGKNDLRLTVWQNVIMPHIADDKIAAVEEELAGIGIGISATSLAAGAVACTGKMGCKLALAYTKENGLALIRHLEEKFTLDKPINIHLTGCPNSCAQHYIADIGLAGTTLPDGSEAYNMVIGGGSDHEKEIGRPLGEPISAQDLNETVASVIETYLERRESKQSFIEFVRDIPDAELPGLLGPVAVAAE